ncbi:hypothetical protein [Citrobacter braakii]|uniref:hypothetical protein n=1 Tax=Citrobacter braakii TaxID=57706 RepID=UPI00244810BF|nr:hypothetical protein [Citrobacter braakii]MDH1755565.1 hypothetical protein [Citrobacter braakii]MDH1853688.1 hypothetical protein [Citrobacter braakii]
MKPDVKKIIADIKATKGNRKFCNGLAGTLQDDNYASSICKYVKTVTPERIDLLIEYAEKLEAEVTDMAVQLANAESKCRELAAENAALKATCDDRRTFIMNGVQLGYIKVPTVDTDPALETIRIAVSPQAPTTATDAFLAEVRASAIRDALDESSDYLDTDCVMDRLDISYEDAELRTSGAIELHDALVTVANQLRKGE